MKRIITLLLCVFGAFSALKAQIVVDSALVPQFVQGINGTNNERVHVFAWVKLSGLAPNGRYGYYVGLDTIGANPTGAPVGIPILKSYNGTNWRRIGSSSMTNQAGHDSILASPTGEWSGWIGAEASGNAKFTPGRRMEFRILMNNGSGGTTVTNRVLLTTRPIRVINFTTSNIPFLGSAIYDSTTAPGGSLAVLYDNTTASSRPISIAMVENDGISLNPVTSIAPFIRNIVDPFPNRWGTIIPQSLANGIQRVDFRDGATGNILLNQSYTNPSAIYCTTNTINPTNGSAAVRLNLMDWANLTANTPPVANPNTASICGGTTTSLTATGIGNIVWFSNRTLTNQIGTGASITSPIVNAPGATFYTALIYGSCRSNIDSVVVTAAVSQTYYPDVDNDGYGDASQGQLSCTPIIGLITQGGDCNDNNNQINPGVSEVCADNIDNNCDGNIDEGCGPNEINVRINATNYPVGSNYAFGSISANDSSFVTFTIENTGGNNLTITPPVTVGGAPYTVTAQPATTIAPLQSTTVTVRFRPSVAGTFNDVLTINNNDSDEGAYTINLSGTATAPMVPLGIDSAFVPQYIQGTTSSTNARIPAYFWVRIEGLMPNARYSYYANVDTVLTGSNGAGIFHAFDYTGTTNRRISSVSFASQAGHDSLFANASGVWEGWVGIESSTNARFTPGNTVYPRIVLNNGAGGTFVVNRLVVSQGMKVIHFTGGNAANLSSGIYDSTTVSPRNIVCLYDNAAGTGRPISTGIVELDGVNMKALTSTATFYRNLVDTIANRWGTVVPQQLSNGVQLVEYRSFATGSVIPSSSIANPTGIWCVSTINPTNAGTGLLLNSLNWQNTRNAPSAMAALDTVCGGSTVNLTATGTNTLTWYAGTTTGTSFATGAAVTSPAINAPGQTFYVRSEIGTCVSPFDSVFVVGLNSATYYEDLDGDGFGGNGSNPVVSCTPIPNWVTVGGDCDDQNNAVNPGATELCSDNIDNNCNNQINEGCPIAEINVRAGSTNIANGDIFNMGSIGVNDSISITFTIENTGNDTLFVFTPVTTTGPFSIGVQPLGQVNPGANTSFIGRFKPTAIGAATGSITISNSDADEGSYTFTVTGTGAGVGLDEATKSSVSIYPNPVKDQVWIEVSGYNAGEVSIQLTDLSGRVVLTTTRNITANDKFSLDMNDLRPGIYLIRMQSANGFQTVKKIIKN